LIELKNHIRIDGESKEVYLVNVKKKEMKTGRNKQT